MASAERTADHALAVAAKVESQPRTILLSWPAATDATEFRVARKTLGAPTWGAAVILPATATQYLDSSVATGVSYEYAVYKVTAAFTAPGFICAGIETPLIENRGTVLLIVDGTHAAALATEITRLRADLVGDGWTVLRRDVSRRASPVQVREMIRDAHHADGNLRSVFLLGHVPVPYSGSFAPDTHPEHEGAWPADAFYGDLDGVWKDTTANLSTAEDPRNHNVPGDGKFDPSTLPSSIELEIGRVDMAALPSFAKSEVELLRQYLDKDHAFRHREVVIERRGLIVDQFGVYNTEAFAATAWGNFWSLLGADAVAEEPWFPTLETESRLFAYACGPGSPISAGSLDVAQFVQKESRAVFIGLFGSYSGDWDDENSLLRAPLANRGAGLATIWAGRPFWFLHPMGQGQTIGYCARLTQNNLATYPPNDYARGVHVALMGDPTLRLHPVAPPSALTATRHDLRVVDLSWSASAETVAGYHVYRAPDAAGPFTRISASLVQGTTFTDAAAPVFAVHMVRAVKLEETPTGTYWNSSEGISVTSGDAAFVPLAGVFEDVTTAVSPPRQLSVKLGSKGTFTASLRLGAETFRVRGALDGTGAFTGAVPEATDLSLSLSFEFPNGSPALVGTLTRGGNVIANFTAGRASKRLPDLVAPGLYTIALPAAPTAPDAMVPEGTGWGTARIGRNGSGRFTFALGDRTRGSASIAVSESGTWSIYVPLYRRTGWLAGRVQFQEIADTSDASGTLSWSKPLAGGTVYPRAFDATVALVASHYTPPPGGRRALTTANVAGNVEWRAESGGLTATLSKIVTIDSANAALPIVPAPEHLKLNIKAASGLVAGSFFHPVLARTVTFSGAILQKPGRALGHFATPNRTGTIAVTRNAQFPGVESGSGDSARFRPALSIATPANGAQFAANETASAITITGRATGPQPIARIEYQIVQNGVIGDMQQAAGGSTWTLPLSLGAQNAGPLTVFIKAIDANGQESLLRSRHFIFNPR